MENLAKVRKALEKGLNGYRNRGLRLALASPVSGIANTLQAVVLANE
jgi:hypothetical protein